MARSWTRLHAHFDHPPGEITFPMVRQAVDAQLEETDDLDWKEALPQPPRDGRWNEFAKDVAAMANTRGGLLIYGVSNSVELVGIDPGSVNEQQLKTWIRNHVQPYLAGLDMVRLTEAESGLSVLVVDVPASQVAPHLVYGTASKDKDQLAAVAPWRDGDHTSWMPEHRLARAYQDRFARQNEAGRELQQHLDYAAELALSHSTQSEAWLVIAARLKRPVPRAVPAPTAAAVRETLTAARQRSHELQAGIQRGMPPVLRNFPPGARAGLRRWVVSNFLTVAEASGTRPVFAELHHDGTAVLATNLSWRALGRRDDITVPLPVSTAVLVPAACDAVRWPVNYVDLSWPTAPSMSPLQSSPTPGSRTSPLSRTTSATPPSPSTRAARPASSRRQLRSHPPRARRPRARSLWT